MTALSEVTYRDSVRAEVGCRFCWPTEETLPLSDSSSYVLPSWGALVEGWLLVTPLEHVPSLSNLDAAAWHAFDELRRQTVNLVAQTYGAAVTFEHGAAGTARLAGCGVDHAHLHVVGLDVDLRAAVSAIQADVGQFVWRRSASQPRPEGIGDYIWLSDSTGEWIAEDQAIPSQVVRRAIAAHLGVFQWDWKADLRIDLVQATKDRLAGGQS